MNTVLLVDDEMILNLSTSTILEQNGYRTYYVNSAEKCLEFLAEQEERPDIILMDINMGPGRLNGAEATRLINRSYDIPVVLYSAYTDKATIDATREMTRYGYIQKIPGNEQLVLATIEMALKLHKMECRERENQEQLRREIRVKEKITQTAPVGIVVMDGEGEISFANRAAKHFFAFEEGGQDGGATARRWKMTDLNGEPLRGPALPFDQVRNSGNPVYDERRAIHRPDGEVIFLSINATPLTDALENFGGMVATIRDITAEHEQNRRIGKINRVLKMLSEANQYLVRIAEERELLERICGVIVETGGYPVAWVGYIEKGSPSRIKPVASAGERKERLSENVPGMDEDSLREGFIGRALRSGSSAIAVCEGRGGGPGMRDEGLRRSGFSCAIALPLTIGEEVIGSLNIYAAMTGGGTKSVDEEEFGLLQQLGEDLSLRLSHLRSNEKRRRAEHALFKSETKYRKIFNNSNDAIYLHSLTEDGMPDKFLEVNDVACRQLGYSRDELLRMGPADIDSGTETERIPAIMEELNRSGAYTFEMRHRRKDGSELPVEISAHRFVLDEVPMVLSTARDVSHLRKVEQELREGERRYRELSIHLQHVREEQLARLSREIHDDLGQSLTALRMNLTVLERDIARVVAEQQRERINTTMEDVKSILMGTVQKTRELVKELRPTVLDTSGLLEALEWQVEEFRRFSGIDVRLHRGSEELELTGDRALAVFRIVQESLTNTARHSNASRVSVSVELDEEELRIDISDNGCGFDTEEANSSFGLLGMRERANFCGGSLSISSTGEGGTRVSLKIPQEELR